MIFRVIRKETGEACARTRTNHHIRIDAGMSDPIKSAASPGSTGLTEHRRRKLDRNMSPLTVSRLTHLGMEYFCHEGDGLWTTSDDDLRALAARELESLGLAKASTVIDHKVIRQRMAYPVYNSEYRGALETISTWMRTLKNFQTVGRNGLHRYNNKDHSMLSAMYAARNILGEDHDVWNVNVERSYHEDFEAKRDSKETLAVKVA